MADIITTQDPAKPGVLKLNGPTLTAAGDLPLTSLSVTGAVNGQAVVLTAGDWAPGNVASSDTASNLGAGSQVFKSKVATDFQFRSILSTATITATQNANDITLDLAAAVTSSICIIADQKASGVNGGTFTVGAWRTRDINTEIADPVGLVTIAANQFVLTAGTYRCIIHAPGCTDFHQARLFNVTGAVVLAAGMNANTNSAADSGATSAIIGRFTVAAAQTLEIQHQTSATVATIGFGSACSFGTEQYTTAIFQKE